jgi:16S rRNA (cytosine1402-N4)-methyltransferase
MTMTAAPHVPVMLDRVVALFEDSPDGVIVDGTVGAGGHARALAVARLRRFGRAHLIGLDRDPMALDLAERNLEDLGEDLTLELVHTRFDALPDVLDERGIDRVAGVLLDLGISSMHVDQAERGFSYRQDAPLDMRMDPALPITAADVVNSWAVGDLARILRTYGEERFADRVARGIVAARPLRTTTELADVVKASIPAAARRRGGHPATRTFQALRIAVNDELGALEAVLPAVIERLAPGGIAVVLSYHSLEDRRVKHAFTEAATGCICPPGLPVCGCGRTPSVEPLVRRSEQPTDDEIAANPRAASARLRAVRRTAGDPR